MIIWTDIAQWHCAHQQRCIDLNRCVCGTYDRQNADFEQRLKQAMERYPNQPQYDHAEHKRFLRGL